jgi:S-adenosylmethionine:tRNA ribosyltransferase-isomerase
LITGLHEPHATHLVMLERAIDAAVGPRRDERALPDGYAAHHLERAYQEAREAGYLWHEFGDSHLIIG